jgi:hypothetical protein
VVLPEEGAPLKLEYLNLGFNNLTSLPEELVQMQNLRVLKAPNNFIEHISAHIVEGLPDLKEFEATQNPLIQPPLEDCERGIEGMRRYYSSLAKSSSKHRSARKGRIASKEATQSIKKAVHLRSNIHNPIPRLGVPETLMQSVFPSATGTVLHALTGVDTLAEGWQAVEVGTTDLIELTFPPASIGIGAALNHRPDVPMGLEKAEEIKTVVKGNPDNDQLAINDTLKIIFVGMACAGKTSIIRRLIDGNKTIIPKQDQRTIGVDIFEWNPLNIPDADNPGCIKPDTSIVVEATGANIEAGRPRDDVHVKFSVWDFAGQNVYHVSFIILIVLRNPHKIQSSSVSCRSSLFDSPRISFSFHRVHCTSLPGTWASVTTRPDMRRENLKK